MSYRMFDYLVPNVNFFGPNAISVVGERCQLLGGEKSPAGHRQRPAGN
ncbi:alcohol dehydrogenase [Klebsiella pneumoniae]|uniref:Alcohol dehydrogenase n=1 Tax=Klebsiella pneumoniae TaxID=573 RepID=A0A377U0K7_KLEPN|nr:alcohol dehydrogenase [Klebsiella pneumoniae]